VASTVNDNALLFPALFVTSTEREPRLAFGEILSKAVAEVALLILMLPTVMSGPADKVRGAKKLVPVNETVTALPRLPAGGLIAVKVGGSALTWNAIGVLVPPGVETVTLRGPAAAPGAMVNDAMATPEFTMFAAFAVIPGPRSNVMNGWKSLPANVKFEVEPQVPSAGLMLVTDGGAITLNTAFPLIPPEVTVSVL